MKPIVLPAALLLVLLALAGCGGGTRTAATTAPPPPPTTTSATSGVPRGFAPLSFTAVSEHDLWLLGTAPCGARRCTAIVHSTDGGRSFTRTPAPPLQGVGAPGVEPTLRFADRDDGWAFVTGAGGAFYATHDGGAHWRRLALGGVLAFAAGGGHAYAVTADCAAAGCTGFRFRRANVADDRWSQAALPFAPDGPVLDLAAHGAAVWLLGARAGSPTPRHDLLARSLDAGASFTVGSGPCYPGLGGTVEPASASVLWAVCPTGMQAGAARSTDGGATFAALQAPPLVNSALLAPASDTRALLVPSGAPARAVLTTDGGATWSQARAPAGATAWAWVGFTDATVGWALVRTQAGPERLWRTTDGGASWRAVALR